MAEIRAALPSLAPRVGLPFGHPTGGDRRGAPRWAELAAETDEPLEFDAVPFDHPLYVLYSSGTTGLPKPIVHGHGGILLEHLKMLALHHDLGSRRPVLLVQHHRLDDVELPGLRAGRGRAIVLFDGNPAYPDLGRCGGWPRRPA